MENINLALVIPLLGALVSVSGAITVIVKSKSERRKLDADAASTLTSSAIGLLKPLENRVGEMEADMKELKAENLVLKLENEKLEKENGDLRKRIVELEAQITEMRERLKELTRPRKRKEV